MRVWTVSEAKAGTLTQCLGVARLIDPKPRKVVVKRELPAWQRGMLSPYRRLKVPEPDLIISCGGVANSHVQAIVAACKVKPFTVHLATPQPDYEQMFDMAFISRHDWNETKARRANWHEMVGVPHQISREILDGFREQARQRWAPKGDKVVTVLAGGPNRAYLYDDATVDRLIETIKGFAADGWTVLASTSRRSRSDLLGRLLALRSERIVVWDREGENPYRDYLAAADAFLVTKDSITMACEALATGRPTYVFDLAKNPGPRLDKFEWFHRDMSETLRLTRPFEGMLDAYPYQPPHESQRVAETIMAEIAKRRPDLVKRAAATAEARKAENAAKQADEGHSGIAATYDTTFAHHRKWLEEHKLLGRPWFFLGSAPDPTIPAKLADNTVYAYIKFAGRSARMHGLPPADITLLTRWKELQQAANLDLKLILRLRPDVNWRGRINRALGRAGIAESQLTSRERDDYVVKTLGSLFSGVGSEKRPSNGVGMICFALAHGIEQVVIAGLSFDVSGHEYERSTAPRRHAAEDRAALSVMAQRYPGVSTTEPSVHEATGLPLYSAS
ncbi:mitochondrial fission ELM1 family protein [Mesorhizobium sp. RP14(2022)]|uniref:Mitochondrial fission ELM1 family protein n=1 Tax=Mesorhizobium liriopis TaxID=2953882 RepID=A0ABT1C7Z0_9HYPH|nr:ELM1/GtrOC1 family putative glycosyltransferase [Mesorhizobium liriopis]MCO6050959.1 mitochondrial fission ELM1 family protein [Mesorhizobium liriopis]